MATSVDHFLYLLYYLRLCEAAQVGHSLPSVCGYVCMFVRTIATNEVRMLKLGTDIHTHEPMELVCF